MHEHEITRGDLADELDVDGGVGLGGRGLVAAAREAGSLERDDAQGESLVAAGDAVLVAAGRRERVARGRSLDHARLQLLELLLVLGTHALQEREGRVRLLLVDLREREADVDEHPVARLHAPPSSSSRPTFTFRRTPATSTRASRLASSTSSITWPGIAKHIRTVPFWAGVACAARAVYVGRSEAFYQRVARRRRVPRNRGYHHPLGERLVIVITGLSRGVHEA